jgi:hypothetical protein
MESRIIDSSRVSPMGKSGQAIQRKQPSQKKDVGRKRSIDVQEIHI